MSALAKMSKLSLTHGMDAVATFKTSNLEQTSHSPIRHSHELDFPPESCFQLTGWPRQGVSTVTEFWQMVTQKDGGILYCLRQAFSDRVLC